MVHAFAGDGRRRRRPRALPLRQPSGVKGWLIIPARRHPLQLHRARVRPPRRPHDVARQGRRGGVRRDDARPTGSSSRPPPGRPRRVAWRSSTAASTRPPFRPVERGGDGPLRIVAVGTLHEVKGQVHLIEACRRLAERGVAFTCRFIGDGPDRDALATRVTAAGLDDWVTFAGRMTSDEVAAAGHIGRPRGPPASRRGAASVGGHPGGPDGGHGLRPARGRQPAIGHPGARERWCRRPARHARRRCGPRRRAGATRGRSGPARTARDGRACDGPARLRRRSKRSPAGRSHPCITGRTR